MFIVRIGNTPHSAWDKEGRAQYEAKLLELSGKTGVSVRKSKEFDGMLKNGHLFE